MGTPPLPRRAHGAHHGHAFPIKITRCTHPVLNRKTMGRMGTRPRFRPRPHAAWIAAAAAPGEGRRRLPMRRKAGGPAIRRPGRPRRKGGRRPRAMRELFPGPRASRGASPRCHRIPGRNAHAPRPILGPGAGAGLARLRAGRGKRAGGDVRACPLLCQGTPEGRRNRPGESRRLDPARRVPPTATAGSVAAPAPRVNTTRARAPIT